MPANTIIIIIIIKAITHSSTDKVQFMPLGGMSLGGMSLGGIPNERMPLGGLKLSSTCILK